MGKTKPELVSSETLCVRYRPFAKKEGENFTKRGLWSWRKNRNFPQPVVSNPRLIWKLDDIKKWELEQGWDFL